MNQKLYRSRTNKVLGGVCGGLGEYFNLDPVLIRVVFVILTFIHGIGILLYIIMLVIVPQKPFDWTVHTETPPSDKPSTPSSTDQPKPEFSIQPTKEPSKGKFVAGIVLVLLGLIFLFDNLFPQLDFHDFLPLVLIVIGISLLWNSIRQPRDFQTRQPNDL